MQTLLNQYREKIAIDWTVSEVVKFIDLLLDLFKYFYLTLLVSKGKRFIERLNCASLFRFIEFVRMIGSYD